MKNKVAAAVVIIWILTLSIVFAVPAKEVRGGHLKNELSCKDCHETETPDKAASKTSCINCHTDMLDAEAIVMKEKGNSYEAYVHDPHETVPNGCSDCHKIHSKSVLYCNIACHAFETSVP